MSVFGFNEAAAIAAWTAFVIYDPSNGAWRTWKHGAAQREKSWWARIMFLPYFLFSFLSMAALVQSIFYFTQTSAADSALLIAGVVLYIVHILADKAWRVAVYRVTDLHTRRNAAMTFISLMLGTAVGLFVVIGLSSDRPFWYAALIGLCVWALDVFVRLGYTASMFYKESRHYHSRHHKKHHSDVPAMDAGVELVTPYNSF